MEIKTILNIVAMTSFIVSFVPTLFGVITILLVLMVPRATMKVNNSFFVWLTLFVWPIVYYFMS